MRAIVPRNGVQSKLLEIAEEKLANSVENVGTAQRIHSSGSVEEYLQNVRIGYGGYVYSGLAVLDLCDQRLFGTRKFPEIYDTRVRLWQRVGTFYQVMPEFWLPKEIGSLEGISVFPIATGERRRGSIC